MTADRRRWPAAALVAVVAGGGLSACSAAALRPKGVVRLAAPAGAASAPTRDAAIVTIRGPGAPATTEDARVACPAGTASTGGGVATTLIGGGRPPSSLHADGTVPAGAALALPTGSGTGPTGWIAVGATGGQLVLGGVTTVYAICLHGFPTPQLVVASVPGPGVATTTARATAVCPAGTVVLGGGGLATVTHGSASPSLHLIGSYPSDPTGTPAAAGSSDPAGWSAVADAGGRTGSGVETRAYAVCGARAHAHVLIARAAAPGPLPASSATTVTAACPTASELIAGGATTGPVIGVPQQGLHLTGSFPSDTAGAGVGSAASATAAAWTARAEAGGQGSPTGTVTTSFAVCLVA